MQTVAMEMLSLATGEPWEPIEPLRAPVFSRPTPFVAGAAAVIDAAGRILLIQRAYNRLWAMPGRALEVGEDLPKASSGRSWQKRAFSVRP